jgi:hypothetical protein
MTEPTLKPLKKPLFIGGDKAKVVGTYANVAAWEVALMALDEWLRLKPTRTQLSMLALVCAGVAHALVVYGAPLLRIVYRGVARRLALWAQR